MLMWHHPNVFSDCTFKIFNGKLLFFHICWWPGLLRNQVDSWHYLCRVQGLTFPIAQCPEASKTARWASLLISRNLFWKMQSLKVALLKFFGLDMLSLGVFCLPYGAIRVDIFICAAEVRHNGNTIFFMEIWVTVERRYWIFIAVLLDDLKNKLVNSNVYFQIPAYLFHWQVTAMNYKGRCLEIDVYRYLLLVKCKSVTKTKSDLLPNI